MNMRDKNCDLTLTFKSGVIVLALVLVSLTAFSQNVANEQFQVAVNAFSDGFYDASLSLFQRFVADFADDAFVHTAELYIAKCYYHKQAYPQALKVLSGLKKLGQKFELLDEVYYWFAVIYYQGEDYTMALEYAEKVIAEYPDSQFQEFSYYVIAHTKLELGDEANAEKIFNKIISDGDQPELIDDVYSHFLRYYFTRNNYKKVIPLSETYLKKYPKGSLRAQVNLYLGESYYVKEQWEHALKYYQQALDAGPAAPLKDLIYHGLGFSYIAGGQPRKAKMAIDKIFDRELRRFSQGTYYYKTNDYIQALETFNIFIRDYPESKFEAPAHLNRADLLYEMGRLNDAIYEYKVILDKFSITDYKDTMNKAHYGLAWCYLKNGEFKKAISEFESTLEFADSEVVKISSQIQIADAYQETEKYLQALDIYDSILANNPNTIYADYIQFQIGLTFLKQQELEKAFFALRNLKNNFPFSKLVPQAQYYLAVGYFSQGNYAEAKSLLKDFIDKFPRQEFYAKAYYLYGKCFFNAGHYIEAIDIFGHVTKKANDPELKELIYIDIGNAFLNLEQFDKAKEIWNTFLKRYPRSQHAGSVLLYLGGLHEKEKKFVDAEQYYRKVIDEYKDSSLADEAVLSLAHLYWNQGDKERAKSYFAQLSAKATPLALKGQLYLAKMAIQEGKNKEALGLLDELTRAKSSIAIVAQLDKAKLLKEMQDYAEAIKTFKAVLESGIDTAQVRFSLGQCLEKIGQSDEALQEYFRVVYMFSAKDERPDINNYVTRSYFRIAKIYEKDNNITSAQMIYQKIIDSDAEEASIARSRLKELGEQ